MKSNYIIILVMMITVAIVATFFITQAYDSKNYVEQRNFKNDKSSFSTNEEFITDLYQKLDLNDPKEVFGYVFSRLDDNITIYPTENYYYFTFPINGKIISGSMSLFASNRDSGVLDIGYIERADRFEQTNYDSIPIGGGANFTAKDGVLVKKIDDFNYSVSFEGKTVVFMLNDVGLTPPSTLTENETFVGPSFDESGLKFFLVFNKVDQHMYWILNEAGFVPEGFTNYTDDIVIGNRTRFAFYVDKKYDRKILIGVDGLNVLQNNWYDGPFDQMPDNYVYTGQIELKKYLEASYPDIVGRIDKYGNYLDEEGARIAVAPYFIYFSKGDLSSIIESCKSDNEGFYSCVTQQIFVVPETFYNTTSVPFSEYGIVSDFPTYENVTQ